MAEKFFPYDPADALSSPAAIEVFLIDAFETGDAGHIVAAFGDVVRAKGREGLAEQVGLSGEQLHQILTEYSNLTLETTLALLKAVGLTLTVLPSFTGSTDTDTRIPEVGQDLDFADSPPKFGGI